MTTRRFPFVCTALLFLTQYSCVVQAFPVAPVGEPIAAIEGLVRRILGGRYVESFVYELIPQENGLDVFEIDVSDGIPVLRGNNGVSLASALNAYLKYLCNCSISWGRDGTGDQLKLPKQLPIPPKKIRVVTPLKYRYYQNVCTVSYSMVWWDFARWERELDWMAMNGINLPLAFTGQEYVWQKLYKYVGLTDQEIDDYFSGPAFLAWQRMGNIKSWGGPLDDEWILNQANMQKKILARARQYGMISVLPGFSGHVPSAIQRIYSVKLTRSSDWNKFNGTYSEDYLLEPTDPLFRLLATSFYRFLIDEFGTDHVFNADTYNEMSPSSSDKTFLAETNKAIYDAMAAVDPEAVFMMQGWLFHSGFWSHDRIEAFLSLVPNDRMIILDMNSESGPIWTNTNSYFGKAFIWCMLHNYGGTRGIYGNLGLIGTEPVKAKQTPNNTMIGTGMTPEAIEHNPVMYDLMAEMGWANSPVDVYQWLRYYSSRRYGTHNPLTEQAWQILKTSAYYRGWSHGVKSVVDRSPEFNRTVDTNFNVSGLIEAWTLLYIAGDRGMVDSSVGPYQYDLVDIGRQCLVDLFYDMYRMYQLAYEKYMKDGTDSSEEMIAIRTEMIALLESLDAYLGTNVNFLFGTWISDARMSAPANASSDVVNKYEFNARNQITMWGYHMNIDDYAGKEWAGMIKDYYLSRWSLFFNHVERSVLSSTTFNDTIYDDDRFVLENDFSNTIKSYPTQPVGDVMAMTDALLKKYTKSPLGTYITVADFDSSSNLFGTSDGPWIRHLSVVAYLCDINPTCVGFNSNGLLKNSTAGMFSSPGTTLYMKSTTSMKISVSEI